MIKKQKLQSSLFKPVVIAIIILYVLSTITLLLTLNDDLPHKWLSLPLFTLDYPLRLLMPVAAFVIGYYATNSNKIWSRLYDGSLFLVAYWWFQLLLFGISIYFLGTHPSPGAAVVETVLPNVAPIILLGLYAIHISKKPRDDLPSIGKGFTWTTICVISLTILFQLAYIASSFVRNNIIFNEFTVSSNTSSLLPPFIFLILTLIGYYVFRRIKIPRIQVFLGFLAATPYVFSSYVWIYLFGAMPSETWLIIIGNIIGLSASAYLLYRMKAIV